MVSVNQHFRSKEKSPGWLERSGIKKGTFSLNKRLKPSPDSKKNTESNNLQHKSSLFVTWAESFIFAGSSALLFHIANLFPIYWYFSFIALIPFLYRTTKATPNESLRLGILFGFSFFMISASSAIPTSLLLFIIKSLLGTGIFTLFTWAVVYINNRYGFKPVLVSLLWTGLEMTLFKLGFAIGFLPEAVIAHPFFHGLVVLFGFVTVSAIIVLLNSLLVLVITNHLLKKRPYGKAIEEEARKSYLPVTRNFINKIIYLTFADRAPPQTSIHSLKMQDANPIVKTVRQNSHSTPSGF